MFTLFAFSGAADLLALRAAHGRLIHQESVPSENCGALVKTAQGLLRQRGDRSRIGILQELLFIPATALATPTVWLPMSVGMREGMQRDDAKCG
jgi:hypothetical protein